jgi:hypothetical protein
MKLLPKLMAKKPAATKEVLVFQKTNALKDLPIQIIPLILEQAKKHLL